MRVNLVYEADEWAKRFSERAHSLTQSVSWGNLVSNLFLKPIPKEDLKHFPMRLNRFVILFL